MNSYDIGDRIRLTGTFRTTDGTLTTPTAVTCQVGPLGLTPTRYTLAGGNPQDSAISVRSAGIVDVEFTLATGGGQVWAHRWDGTGAVEAAEDAEFFVRTPAFG